MDVRGKLVELMNKASEYAIGFCIDHECEECPGIEHGLGCRDWIAADHLIANGVTVQEWISVEDRLPESGSVVLAYHNCINDRRVAFEIFNDNEWFDFSIHMWDEAVTHWMPLPEPPDDIDNFDFWIDD